MGDYVYKPLWVKGFQIVDVKNDETEFYDDGSKAIPLSLDSGETRITKPGMCARMKPEVGDYWVIQPDGYEYLNPKAVFENKFLPYEEIDITANVVSVETL